MIADCGYSTDLHKLWPRALPLQHSRAIILYQLPPLLHYISAPAPPPPPPPPPPKEFRWDWSAERRQRECEFPRKTEMARLNKAKILAHTKSMLSIDVAVPVPGRPDALFPLRALHRLPLQRHVRVDDGAAQSEAQLRLLRETARGSGRVRRRRRDESRGRAQLL